MTDTSDGSGNGKMVKVTISAGVHSAMNDQKRHTLTADRQVEHGFSILHL